MTGHVLLVTPRQSGNASPELPAPLAQELWPHCFVWPVSASASMSGNARATLANGQFHGAP